MEPVIQQVHCWLFDFWQKHGDARSSEYLLIRNGLYTPLAILLVYFFLVTQIGPRLMHHRKPFNLKEILLGYNFIMVIMNFHFFIETLRFYNYGMDIFDFEYPRLDDLSPLALKKVAMCHTYLLSKFLDLIETLFFCLRKKNGQISKLHLYHHISVPLLGWIAVRMVPTNGPLAIFAILNTLIHTIMYAYYGLAALGPAVRPFLWWKRHITQLQIGQFAVYSIFSGIFAFCQRGYPISLQILAYTQPIIFLVLFYRFYVKAYTRNSKQNSHDEMRKIKAN